jgi:hypothetical protein
MKLLMLDVVKHYGMGHFQLPELVSVAVRE